MSPPLNVKYPNARILVFAKAPQPGQVKSRLQPLLTPTEAAALHTQLVQRTLTTATRKPLCPVELWCAPTTDHPFFRQCRNRYGIELQRQQGGDIGARMEHALRTALARAEPVILIGTDCPMLTPDDLEQALKQLNRPEAPVEVVLGPAEDGGYVLIGARRSHPTLFRSIEWGTATVLESTRQRLEELGWPWGEIGLFWDLDRPDDWFRYRNMMERERGRAATTDATLQQRGQTTGNCTF